MALEVTKYFFFLSTAKSGFLLPPKAGVSNTQSARGFNAARKLQENEDVKGKIKPFGLIFHINRFWPSNSIFFSMRPARFYLNSHAARESLWGWDPWSKARLAWSKSIYFRTIKNPHGEKMSKHKEGKTRFDMTSQLERDLSHVNRKLTSITNFFPKNFQINWSKATFVFINCWTRDYCKWEGSDYPWSCENLAR